MNQSYNVEVGEKLRKARKAKKMSMKQLGELVNLHESTISRYEKGEINALDIDKLKEFAQVLGVPAVYLMGYDTPKQSDHSRTKEYMRTRWESEIGAFDLTEREIDDLIEYAKFLRSKRREQR